MRKTRELRMEWAGALVVLTLLLVMLIGLSVKPFAIVSHAESQGTVSVASATIRKDADKNSEALGSATQGQSVTINGEVTGSDGMVWYQVVANNVNGYIRSDLVQKAEGGDPGTAAPSVTVEAVQPQSATVVGEQVRIRQDASDGSAIVTTVQSDVVLTVTGRATASDNSLWYQVTFIDNGADVTGFVREDFITLGGELVPVGAQDPAGGEQQPSGDTNDGTSTQKPYDVQLVDGDWHFMNYETNEHYKVEDLLLAATENGKLYEESLKTIKGQKIGIIVLVILLVAAVLGLIKLFFKVKDVMDEAYFTAVEKETIRERSAVREKRTPGSKVMPTVGSDSPRSRAASGKTAKGTKTAPVTNVPSNPTGYQNQPPRQGGRPQGNGYEQKKTIQGQGARQAPGQNAPRQGGASGRSGASSRTSELYQGMQSAAPRQGAGYGNPGANQNNPSAYRHIPQGTNVGRQVTGHTQPIGSGRGNGHPPTAPYQGQSRQPAGHNPQVPGRRSKNFMVDDDEFEFEFLNWEDGDK